MKSRYGFTLIELIITMVMLSTIMIVVSEVYLRGMISSRSEISESHLQIEAKNVLEGITDNIKSAALVESSYGGYTTGASQIILAVPAIDKNSSDASFLYSGSNIVYDYIVYFIQGNSLHKAVIAENANSKRNSENGRDSVLLADAKSLDFTYSPAIIGAKLINVSLVAEDDTQKTPQDISLTAQVKLRND